MGASFRRVDACLKRAAAPARPWGLCEPSLWQERTLGPHSGPALWARTLGLKRHWGLKGPRARPPPARARQIWPSARAPMPDEPDRHVDRSLSRHPVRRGDHVPAVNAYW